MIKKIKIIIAFSCSLISSELHSQPAIPLGTLPMLYNGGFAGEGKYPRFNAGAAFMQKDKLTDGIKDYSYFASYDEFIPSLRSGIGVTYIRDEYRYSNLSRSKNVPRRKEVRDFFTLSISPKFSIGKKYTVAPFVDWSFVKSDIEQRHVYFGGAIGNSASLRTGFLVNTRNAYLGFNYYLWRSDDRLQERYYVYWLYGRTFAVQGGYSFQRSPDSKFSFTPQMVVFRAGRFGSAEINLIFRYGKFIWSINNSGLGLGLQARNLCIQIHQTYALFGYLEKMGALTVRYTLKPGLENYQLKNKNL